MPQVGQTWAFLWSELLEREYSDNFLNEWGVAVVSDRCPSREDDAATLAQPARFATAALAICSAAWWPRREVGPRRRAAGRPARRAVWLFRFRRTYVIADPHEAWLVAVVCGRHWVARRVPDDQVVVLPNVYITDRVDLSDSNNYLGSPDLIEYARRRGWFRPESGAPFRFDRAYAAPHDNADRRRGLGKSLSAGEKFPGRLKTSRLA